MESAKINAEHYERYGTEDEKMSAEYLYKLWDSSQEDNDRYQEKIGLDAIFTDLTKSVKKANAFEKMDELVNLIIDSQKYLPDISTGIEAVIRKAQKILSE